MSMLELNLMAARGRAKREKRNPVMSGLLISATGDATARTRAGAGPTGLMSRSPIVANVSTLKKNSRQYGPPISRGVAPTSASAPQSRNAAAKSTLSERYESAESPRKRGHDIPSSE